MKTQVHNFCVTFSSGQILPIQVVDKYEHDKDWMELNEVWCLAVLRAHRSGLGEWAVPTTAEKVLF